LNEIVPLLKMYFIISLKRKWSSFRFVKLFKINIIFTVCVISLQIYRENQTKIELFLLINLNEKSKINQLWNVSETNDFLNILNRISAIRWTYRIIGI